jgi:AbrB family looped-hinge helix DNA binding protein
MTTRVSSKGQIVLPSAFRDRDGIKAGQEFEIVRLEKGKYRLTRRAARRSRSKKLGVVDWLLSCPVKGFFVPIKSESTDTL